MVHKFWLVISAVNILDLFVLGLDGIKVGGVFTALRVSLKGEKWSPPHQLNTRMTEERETAERYISGGKKIKNDQFIRGNKAL